MNACAKKNTHTQHLDGDLVVHRTKCIAKTITFLSTTKRHAHHTHTMNLELACFDWQHVFPWLGQKNDKKMIETHIRGRADGIILTFYVSSNAIKNTTEIVNLNKWCNLLILS